MARNKKPYLVNPFHPKAKKGRRNPMVDFHPHIRVWRDPISGKFGGAAKKKTSIMGRRSLEKALLHTAAHIPSTYVAPKHALGLVGKKVRKAHKAAHTRKMHEAQKRAFVARMKAGRLAAKKGLKRTASKIRKSIVVIAPQARRATAKSQHRSTKSMAKKSHKKSRKSTRKNPFSPMSILGGAKKLVNTGLLIDSSLIGVGLAGGKLALEFGAAKIPFLATPYGKIIARVGLGLGVDYAGRKLGQGRYSEPIALGILAPALLELVDTVMPNLLPAGTVQLMLGDGYMPDIASSQVSLEQGYMPDVQGQVSEEYA